MVITAIEDVILFFFSFLYFLSKDITYIVLIIFSIRISVTLIAAIITKFAKYGF